MVSFLACRWTRQVSSYYHVTATEVASRFVSPHLKSWANGWIHWDVTRPQSSPLPFSAVPLHVRNWTHLWRHQADVTVGEHHACLCPHYKKRTGSQKKAKRNRSKFSWLSIATTITSSISPHLHHVIFNIKGRPPELVKTGTVSQDIRRCNMNPLGTMWITTCQLSD